VLAEHASGVEPRLDLATSNADWSVVATKAHARDPARLRGVVQPRTRDAKQLDNLGGSEEPNVRMIRTVHIA
jgi:hypothetical protein